MSFFGMAFLGMMPFGSLFAVALAGLIGADTTVLVGGIASLMGAFRAAAAAPIDVRPIYIRMGILPEVASGVQTATELRATSEH